MGSYLINFAAYTLAMVGIIFLCLVIYKKCFSDFNKGYDQSFLKVENCLNISPRKSIYVIKAGEEKFLIASDVESTSFLAKLDSSVIGEKGVVAEILKAESGKRSEKSLLEGVSVSTDFYTENSNVTKLPVMRELMRKLNSQRG